MNDAMAAGFDEATMELLLETDRRCKLYYVIDYQHWYIQTITPCDVIFPDTRRMTREQLEKYQNTNTDRIKMLEQLFGLPQRATA